VPLRRLIASQMPTGYVLEGDIEVGHFNLTWSEDRRKRMGVVRRTVETPLFAVSISFLAIQAHAAETFTYVAWIHDEVVSIEQPENGTNGSVIHAQDAVFESEFCAQASEYLCVFSPIYAFAIPSRFDGSVRTWSVNSTTFEVVESGLTVSIFGAEVSDVSLIRTPAAATLLGKETATPTFSLYSPEHGLIGFRIPKSLEVYWLVGDIGFGRSD